MTLWLIQLEPLVERYSEQWSRWIPDKLKEKGIEHQVILGSVLSETIEKGAFLDIESSNYHRFSQLMKICQLFKKGKIQTGDIFWSYDFYHPGIEAIKYMAELQDIKVKVFANYHACSVTREDFIQPLRPWSKYFEQAWIRYFDGVFAATNYAKEQLVKLNELEDVKTKIHVTGNPWNTKEALSMVQPLPEKTDTIIFPNRWDYEKRPNLFIDLCTILAREYPELEFLVTTSRPTFRSCHPWLVKLFRSTQKLLKMRLKVYGGLSKGVYYRLLAESKIMFSSSITENFGYTCLEAMTFQTVPVCPNRYSYPELLGDWSIEYLYEDLDDALEKIDSVLSDTNKKPWLLDRAKHYDTSIDRMIKVMEEN